MTNIYTKKREPITAARSERHRIEGEDRQGDPDVSEPEEEEFVPEWRLWISKRIGMEGEPFDIWNYDADVGDVYSMRVWGYADEPGTAPNEEDPRWFWEIFWGTSGGARNDMLEGEATSRAAAKRDCVNALLLQMLSIFKDTGDLLQGALSDQLKDDEDLGDFDWGTFIEPLAEDSNRDSWRYSLTHDEFYLTLELPLELPVELGKPPIAPELGAWRWWIIDNVDTICEGTAPSRTLARQLCVGALLDHLTTVCSITEQLRDLDFPSSECANADHERPSIYEHEDARLDPNFKPRTPDHPVTKTLMRSVEAGSSVDSVLVKVRELFAELRVEDLHSAIEVHRANCPTANCPVLAAMEKYAAARETPP